MGLTEKGFERPGYDELLQRQIERAQLLFGEDIDTAENTVLGKYIRLNVTDLVEIYEILEKIYFARFVHTATGQSLDRLVPFASIRRNQATYAKHNVKFTGTAGETIPGGFLVAAGDIQFYTANDYTFDENGVVTGQVNCTQTGTIGNVGTGKIDTIVEPSPDVLEIEHLGIAVYAEDIESDAALRLRFDESIAGSGSATRDAIEGAIARVPLVDGVEVIENDTGETVDGIPPYSFICYVLSPESQDELVGAAILSKKPVGIKCIGDVEVEVPDKGGKMHTMRFSRTIQKNISMKISINTNNYFEHDGVQQIKDNIAFYVNNLRNGDDVYISSIFGYIHDITGVVNVPSLTLSVDGKSYSTSNIEIDSKEVARVSVDDIEITVEGMILNA